MGNIVVDMEYYDWLLEQIDYYPGDDLDIDIALGLMFSTPFRWSIKNDDNRAEDGLQLRSIFMDEEGWNTNPYFEESCSVLEVLIALAIRIENDIMWDGETDRTSKWFWEMYNNLGFNKVDHSDYNFILNVFLDRKYDENGVGGLFPLTRSSRKQHKNQRKIEIWNQAQAYLMENYEF